MANSLPRRRAIGFRLPTILLLTAFVATWLTRQVLFVRGRTMTFNYAVAAGAELDVGGPPAHVVRRMLGDLRVKHIIIDKEHSPAKLEGLVRHYFPEATIAFR